MLAIGVKKGDHVAIWATNVPAWYITFWATTKIGAVLVTVNTAYKIHEAEYLLKQSDTHTLVMIEGLKDSHYSEIIREICPELDSCPKGELNSKRLPVLKNIITVGFEMKGCYTWDEVNGKAKEIPYSEVEKVRRTIDKHDVCNMQYTSGTTGYSKGVMLPYRSILSNVVHIDNKVGLKAGDRIVSMLPLGHIFGLVFDFLYGITAGAHLWFLTRMPSPKIIAESFTEIRPRIIACVPLIVEKIFKKNILPKVDNKLGKLLLNLPIISDKIKENIRQQAMEVFGGNFIEIVVGGAPFNAEVEAFLRKINFPYTIAYGMTECAPLICHSRWDEIQYTSCGKTVANMETRVLSDDPTRIPGELVCRGMNTMLGYYKNEKATEETIDKEGWLHTGDMAIKDEQGNIYIKGRCKNMLLTASGQNIYPEEIEARLNNMPFVNESLVILQNNKLIALVYPDNEEAFQQNMNAHQLEEAIENNRIELNSQLPAYAQITRIKLYPEEFEKTAKKSIKRYLYQDIR